MGHTDHMEKGPSRLEVLGEAIRADVATEADFASAGTMLLSLAEKAGAR
jgi:hypothetical protein